MAKTHRIAVVPGDGIGKETVPEALKVLDAAARRFGFGLEFARYNWCMRDLQEDRRDGARRRHGATGAVGIDPARRGRLAQRARPYLAVGPAESDPARLRPVRDLRPCKLMPACARRLPSARADLDYCVVRRRRGRAPRSVDMFGAPGRELVAQQACSPPRRRSLLIHVELARTRPKRWHRPPGRHASPSPCRPRTTPRAHRARSMRHPHPPVLVDILSPYFRPASGLVRRGGQVRPFSDILFGPATVAGSIGIAPSPTSIRNKKIPLDVPAVRRIGADIAADFHLHGIGQIGGSHDEHLGEAEAGRTIVAAIKKLLQKRAEGVASAGSQVHRDVGNTLAQIVAHRMGVPLISAPCGYGSHIRRFIPTRIQLPDPHQSHAGFAVRFLVHNSAIAIDLSL